MKFKKSTLAMIFAFAAAATVTEPFWATDAATTQQTLTEAGLTPTKIGGSYTEYGFFTCPTSLYATNFEAKTQAGNTVQGRVCSGPILKDTTIEIDGMRK